MASRLLGQRNAGDMSCLTQHPSDENLTVMRGETIVGDFVVTDDYGRRVTSVDGITVLLTDKSGGGADPIVFTIGEGIDFSKGNFRFIVQPEISIGLPSKIGMEIKITVNGIVRIAVSKSIAVIDNTVKDY